MKGLAIFLLLAALVFVSARLIYVENQRYAMVVGLCRFKVEDPNALHECLRSVQARDSGLWHLYYGLTK